MTVLSMRSQWIELPPAVREVMGLIPVGDSDFNHAHYNRKTFKEVLGDSFFVPRRMFSPKFWPCDTIFCP